MKYELILEHLTNLGIARQIVKVILTYEKLNKHDLTP